MKVQEVYDMNIKELDLHPLALSTPRMTTENYTALKADIEVNGQLEPITLYRGRIIDGRHRWLILKELEEDTIKALKLPNNTTVAKLKTVVQSKEIRRHETPTQLAITAYRLMLNSKVKLTQAEAADKIGADRRKVGNCKMIASKYQRPDILETLFDGSKLDIGSAYEPFKTDSLPAIIDWLKSMAVKPKANDTRGQVEMTEEQFTECAVKVQELKGLDIKQVKHIASKLYGHVKEYEELVAEKKEEANV